MKRTASIFCAVTVGLALVSCGSSSQRSSTTSTAASPTTQGFADAAAGLPAIQTLLAGAAPLRRFSLGYDHLGVWICHVPVGVKDPMYNPVAFRLDLQTDRVTDLLNRYVSPYFATLSNGLYRPTFTAGGEVSISVDETDQDCVDKAQRQSAEDIAGLVVIADAEHAQDQHGGWGRPGVTCAAADPCPARLSGRAAYIGASDFHPDWGPIPAVDLLEHEIGHTLGFPHSGGGDGYLSGIDLMSNSAAPRDIDPTRRNAPDTLAINRLAAGWLPTSDVAVADADGSFSLVASPAPAGPRLLVLPIDGLRFLTVEALDNSGFDAHLPHAGIVVHEIDQSPTACGSGTGTEPCLNEYRSQLPLSDTKPFTDLLRAGATWKGLGWSITVSGPRDGTWTIDVARTGSATSAN